MVKINSRNFLYLSLSLWRYFSFRYILQLCILQRGVYRGKIIQFYCDVVDNMKSCFPTFLLPFLTNSSTVKIGINIRYYGSVPNVMIVKLHFSYINPPPPPPPFTQSLVTVKRQNNNNNVACIMFSFNVVISIKTPIKHQ